MRVATWNVNGLRRGRLPAALAARAPARRGGPPGAEARRRAVSARRARGARLPARCVTGRRAGTASPCCRASPPRRCRSACPARRSSARGCSPRGPAGSSSASVYVPNGKYVGHEDFPRKLAWLDALAGAPRARSAPERPPAWWAATSTSVRRPSTRGTRRGCAGHIFHTDEERARFQRLLDARARRRLPRAAPGDAGLLLVGLPRPAASTGATACASTSCSAASSAREARARVEIDRDWRKKQEGLTPSDHAPVWADVGGDGVD